MLFLLVWTFGVLTGAKNVFYRVFKKEGEKVDGYFTTENKILGAIYGFILTTRMGYLIICIRFYIFLYQNMKSRYLINRKSNCDSKYQKSEKLKKQLFLAH